MAAWPKNNCEIASSVDSSCSGSGLVCQGRVDRSRERRLSRRMSGGRMSNRYWFYADRGQQQGPFPEAQFRDFIARGVVRADTLVWTEGMAGWQSAGEIPGFFSPAARPPSMSARMPAAANGDGGALSIDFEILDFVVRFLVFFVGAIFIVPLPWVLVSNL